MELKGIGRLAGDRGGPGAGGRARGGARLPPARCPPEAVEAEVRAPAAGGGAPPASSSRPSGTRLSREVGVPHAYIFDAHLLMLEDPLLLDRRAGRSSGRSTSTPSGRCARCPSSCTGCSTGSSDAYLRERAHRPRRRAGPHPAEPGRAPGTRRRCPGCPGSFVVVADDLHAVGGGGAGLGARAGASPPTPARATYHTVDPGPLVRRPGGGGAGRRHPADPAGRAGGGGRLARPAWWSSPRRPMLAGFREAQERDRAEEVRLQSMRALPAVTARRRAAIACAPTSEFPDEAATRGCARRGGHRPLPLGVPAGALAASGRARSGRSRSTGGCWSRCGRTR